MGGGAVDRDEACSTAAVDADTPARPGFPRAAALFVWGTWALMLLAALGYVAFFMTDIPFGDDWHLTPALTKSVPLTSWLMEWNSEHRLPLSRLVMKAALKLSGNDFRAGVALNVLGLGTLAALLLLAARALRGGTGYADAFFPLLLLNWGHYESFVQNYYVVNVLPVFLACVVLLVIALHGTRLTLGAAILSAVCVALLPLCGGPGLIYLPAFAAWFGYLGVRRWRSADPSARRDALTLFALSLATLAAVRLYFIGFPAQQGVGWTTWDWEKIDLSARLRGAVQYLTIGLGPSAERYWPLTGATVLVLVLTAVAVAARAFLEQPAERPRALGLLLFSGTVLFTALAIGWTRGYAIGNYEMCFARRYVVLAAPALCCAYVICCVYRAAASPFVTTGLCVLAAAALPYNTWEGYEMGLSWRQASRDFERDVRSGMPPYLLISRYSPEYFQEFAPQLPLLRDAGVRPFQNLKPDPRFREVRLTVSPRSLHEMTWEGGIGHVQGSGSYAEFALDEPRFVGGIRLRLRYLGKNRAEHSTFQAFWKRPDQPGYLELRYFDSSIATHAGGPYNIRGQHFRTEVVRTAEEQEVVFWVGETIDRFRLHPADKPCDVEISEIVLLLPEADGPGPH